MWANRTTPGVGARAGRFAAILAVLVLVGCNYSFRAGAGFPDHIRTIAILPFENETNRFELPDQVHQQLLQELPAALGIQPGGRENADAVLEGVVTGYDVTTPSYRSDPGGGGAEVLQREVRLRVAIRIVDRTEDVILWEDRSLSAQGQYLVESESEETARREAVEILVQAVVDGAQSNW